MQELTPAELGKMWQWCQDESPIPGQDELVDDFRHLILDDLWLRARLTWWHNSRWDRPLDYYFRAECEKAGITPPKE